MADSAVPVTPGQGMNVDTRTQPNGDHRQVIVIGDPTNTDVMPLDPTYGIPVDIKRSAVETNLEIKNLGGTSIYSNISGDFTAVFTNGTKELVLSAFANAALEAALSVGSLANGNVKRIRDGAVISIPLTSLSLLSTTYTLADAPDNFVTGDIAVVTIIGPDKGYSSANNAFTIDPLADLEGEDPSAHLIATIFKPVLSETYAPLVGDNTYGTRVTKKLEKAAPGNVYSVQVFNFGTALAYFQLHNKASAAPVAGETPMPGCVWPVPAGNATSPGILSLTIQDLAPSNYHSTGIGWALSSTLSTFTDALTATDFVVNLRRI